MRERKGHQAEEADQVDLQKLLKASLQYWYLPMMGILLGLGVAYLYMKVATPVYDIRSKLLIKDDKKGPDLNGNAVLSELVSFKSISNMDNEVELLRSESLMLRVLQELALQTNFYVKGQFFNRELWGRELPIRVMVHEFDSSSFNKTITLTLEDKLLFKLEETDENDSIYIAHYQYGQRINRPYGSFTVLREENSKPITTAEPIFGTFSETEEKEIIVRFNNIRQLAINYNKALKIAPVSKTASVILLSLKDPVPEKGRAIINKLIELYNREGIEDKNFIATNTIAFLDERLEFLTEELKNVEKDVETYKRSKVITDVSSQAMSYIENASDYKKQLADLSIQIEVLESIETYLQKQGDDYALVPSTLGILDPTLIALITKYNEAQLERERMLRTTQSNNPLVTNLNDQLSGLKLNILENLRNIKSGLLITLNKLDSNSGQYASKMQEVPSIERHLQEISRQQGIKQGLYLHLLQKREESALSLAATVSNVRVIDPPVAGEFPSSPNPLIVLFVALLVGLCLPIGMIYLKMITNDKVQERKDITRLTATPVLGEIARKKTNETLVVTEKSRMPVAEMFRLLRINLNFSTVGKENKVIMIASSMSGEGKTFFSINLAASLALTGKKVVMLDLDLRKPSILNELGMINDIGVTNYIISKELTLDDIVKPIKSNPSLFVIGTGPLPPNPAEFAMSPKMGQLIQELKDNFDHIIMDTSPVGQVSDAYLLAPFVDTVLYMVRYGYTFKAQLAIIDDIYREKKLQNPLIVLNDAKKVKGYGYGYGYGEKVAEKKPKPEKVYA